MAALRQQVEPHPHTKNVTIGQKNEERYTRLFSLRSSFPDTLTHFSMLQLIFAPKLFNARSICYVYPISVHISK
jgi:hypothetical protein